MKLVWGPVPESPGFEPRAEGFVPLREPSDGALILASIPISLALFVVFALAWNYWVPDGWYTLGLVDLAFGVVAMIVLHEWVHALTLPDQGAGENTVFGFYLRHVVFYTHYEGPIDRDQFLLTLLSPFVLLSIVPLVFCALIGEAPALLRFVSVWNAMGCSADILGFFLIVVSVPKHAAIRNQGTRTWWQPAYVSVASMSPSPK